MTRTLEERGHDVAAAFSWDEAEEQAGMIQVDYILLVVQDLISTDLSQLEVLKESAPAAKVIVISPQHEQAVSMEAMKYGAWDYFAMPLNIEALFQSMDQSVKGRKGG